jgi:hypothetical protein
MMILMVVIGGMSIFSLVWLGYWMSGQVFIYNWHLWWGDRHLFGLKCEVCQKWTTGCRLHFLCGCCDQCAMTLLPDDPAA